MLWVDHESYFGPDRRVKPSGFRFNERRRENYAGSPPPLATALRQLRMRVLNAHGDGARGFADRAHGTALLAERQHEPEAADILSAVARKSIAWRGHDLRPALYADLDRAHASLRYH